MENAENTNKSKEYYQTYINKHRNDPKIDCSICYGSYTIFNKHHHISTKKHKRGLEINKNNPQRILNI
jgi:hypothetical protein